jgi:hypothetical protein
MTTTDDRETELLADALAQTYSDAVLAPRWRSVPP